MSSWIKLHRKIEEHWIFEDPDYFRIWMAMLFAANYKDNESLVNGQVVDLKRGQLIFGLNAWSSRYKVTSRKLRTLIKNLESCGMIDRQTTNKYSIISITNYDSYQSSDNQTTTKRQSDDIQVTTPKESKEVKKGKEVNGIDQEAVASTPPCPYQEIVDLYHEHCPTLPRVKILNDSRKRQLKARWRESGKHQDLNFWRKYFAYVDTSGFMKGENDRNWTADFDFVINASKFTGIIEGKYHREMA